MQGNTAYSNNAVVVLKIYNDGSGNWVFYYLGGTTVSGTWNSRGYMFGGSGAWYNVLQRTA
jgi:hypothetical protein